MAVFGVMIYYGVIYVQVTSAQLSAAMRIPMQYIYIAIPLSGSIMMLHSISNILQLFVAKEEVQNK
jgi:TRAP-type C4-dicarboxylate transport system permease small subunit